MLPGYGLPLLESWVVLWTPKYHSAFWMADLSVKRYTCSSCIPFRAFLLHCQFLDPILSWWHISPIWAPLFLYTGKSHPLTLWLCPTPQVPLQFWTSADQLLLHQHGGNVFAPCCASICFCRLWTTSYTGTFKLKLEFIPRFLFNSEYKNT